MAFQPLELLLLHAQQEVESKIRRLKETTKCLVRKSDTNVDTE
jgi:hypothetical protein